MLGTRCIKRCAPRFGIGQFGKPRLGRFEIALSGLTLSRQFFARAFDLFEPRGHLRDRSFRLIDRPQRGAFVFDGAGDGAVTLNQRLLDRGIAFLRLRDLRLGLSQTVL